jgi:RNA polymerase sigma factor (sigma-70 family)
LRYIDHGDSARRAAGRLLRILEHEGVRALKKPIAEPRHQNIDSVLAASTQLLGRQDLHCLERLSVFPEDAAIKFSLAAAVWLDEFETEEVALRLARLSLLNLDLGRGTLRLHDVMRSWLAAVWDERREDICSREQLTEILDQALGALDPCYRAVFVLREIEDLSTEETAEALGLSISAVKSCLSRGKLKVRNNVARLLQLPAENRAKDTQRSSGSRTNLFQSWARSSRAVPPPHRLK